MWEKLEQIFIGIGLPYSRQGSYESEDAYPPSFFTFWNVDTPEAGFYDNQAHRAVWFWYVYFYTKNASILYSQLDEFITKAKAAGFIVEGRGIDVPSGSPDYFGRMVRVKFIQHYNQGGNNHA